MTLKELSDIMQERGASLVISQEEALKCVGVSCVKYTFNHYGVHSLYAEFRSPAPLTNVHLTTEPIAGKLLLTGKWKKTWGVFELYELTNGETVDICSRMLDALFGNPKPEFLYLTKVEGEAK